MPELQLEFKKIAAAHGYLEFARLSKYAVISVR